jgi:hypothetical protein
MIRGQIVKDSGSRSCTEPTSFRGNHYVEVYIVKNGVVVAKDHDPVIITEIVTRSRTPPHDQ